MKIVLLVLALVAAPVALFFLWKKSTAAQLAAVAAEKDAANAEARARAARAAAQATPAPSGGGGGFFGFLNDVKNISTGLALAF